ncbi:MAG: MogA/MoaB family molybdenum cofactor biosynthesis protein [Planctomycetota bacterium]|nr:MogA/MoaB family molybdenum cofactor biosynthesis protein [Planctomycetota bacterium]
MNVILILASDRVASGEKEDGTTQELKPLLDQMGALLMDARVVADEEEALVAALETACKEADLVLTSGGTGIGSRDVTPEATRRILDRELVGFGEVMRRCSSPAIPTACLSRATAGTRGSTLVINLPGSPRGAAECLAALIPAILHGVAVLDGKVEDCVAEQLGGNDPL